TWKVNEFIIDSGNYIYIEDPGVYKLIVTTPNGCKDSSSVTTTEQANPDIPQIYATGKSSSCGGSGVALCVHNDPLLTYQWCDLYGNALPGETDTIFYPTQSDQYTVRAISANHCTAISSSASVQTDSTIILQPIIISDSNF